MAQSTQPLPWRTRAARASGRFFSPAVRNAARELGVDTAGLLGRGRGGRVTRDDVIAAAAPPHGRDGSTRTADVIVPFNNVRKRSAPALLASRTTVPHALTVVAADYGSIDAARRGLRITALPFVARAVVDALHEFPYLNATLDDDAETLVVHREIGLGIAVDLDHEGLVVPVIRGAEGLRVRAMADAIRAVAGKARQRKLLPDDLAGGTFTITNPGAAGTWLSFPIINRPQVAILSTDGVSKQVVADENGRMRIAPIGQLCCAFDHRAVDGAYAGAFLGRVREIVEMRDWAAELR